MKIGDKVRFLTEVGGGVVTGFQGKDIVLVEDEDGFDIPMPLNGVVVVGDTDALNFERHAPSAGSAGSTAATVPKNIAASKGTAALEGIKPAFLPQAPSAETVPHAAIVQEFAGHDVLNVHLAFLPADIKAISTTLMEAWLVNDSNYFVHYLWSSIGSGNATLLAQGMLEPNSVVFLREFTRDMYEQLEHVSFQLMAWKEGKSYLRKPCVDAELRIDTVRFFKLHTFTDTPFFEEPAMLCDVVVNDHVARPSRITAEVLEDALNGSRRQREARPARLFPEGKKQAAASGQPLEVDLHIDALLDTTAGMSPADMLDYQVSTFRRVLDEQRGKKGTRMVFIHGKGDGVLRAALQRELSKQRSAFVWQDASFQRYGFGAMLVIVR